MLFVLFLGLLVRLGLVLQPGFEADVAYWKSWSLAASDNGLVWITNNTNYNYPAGFAYVLWLIALVYKLFANPDNYQQFWNPNNYLFLLCAKLPSILSDLAVGAGIYWLLRRPKLLGLEEKLSRLALPLAIVYLFHPVAIYDGSWWGQVDSVGLVFILFAIIALVKRRPIWASIIITLGSLLKLQTIVLLPLFFLYLWRAFSWKEMAKGLAAAAITYVVITLPFLWANSLSRTFYLVYQNADWFPLLSLRAYNLWWLASKGAGMATSDKILTLGITSAKTLGLILFSVTYLLSVGLIWVDQKPKNLILAFVFACFSFYFFPTQSHERYIFPALMLSILLIPYFWENMRSRRIALGGFALLSLTTLINLNTSMVANYPGNGLPLLSWLAKPSIDTLICLVNLLAIIVLLVYVLKNLPKIWWLGSAGLLTTGLLFTNLSYLTSGQVALSKLKPTDYNQGYGGLQFDRNANSSFGPGNWSFLSVNYFFYQKGLGTHANSVISFDINRLFKKFATDFGIDTAGGSEASVVFEIWGDGRQLFASPKMMKADLPKHIEVPVEGVKKLTLVVTDAGDGIRGDHADWLEPTLYK